MKILYVSTISNTVNAFLIPHIRMLINEGHQVDVAFNLKNEVCPKIYDMGCKVYQVPFQRSPLNIDNFRSYQLLKNIINTERYDLVHTHTPVASAIVRLVCKNLKEVKVFYTAHGFHFFKGAPIKNWIIYYPIEKYLAKYTDTLITINTEDYDRAKKSFKTRKIEYVPGVGLNVKKINEVVINKIEIYKEIGVPKNALVFISVGELNNNKNHKIVIESLSRLNNPNLYYIICGQGYLKKELMNLICKLNLQNHVKLLGFRNDVLELYKASDLFIFPSFREGLSVSLMEAMACGLPIVCSNIRGNTDLIDEKGGSLFDPHSVDSCKEAISKVLNNNIGKVCKYNTEKIEYFSTDSVIKKMGKLYKEVFE